MPRRWMFLRASVFFIKDANCSRSSVPPNWTEIPLFRAVRTACLVLLESCSSVKSSLWILAWKRGWIFSAISSVRPVHSTPRAWMSLAIAIVSLRISASCEIKFFVTKRLGSNFTKRARFVLAYFLSEAITKASNSLS